MSMASLETLVSQVEGGEVLCFQIWYLYLSYLFYWSIGLMSRVFANGPEDWGSIPGQVIPKTQKMILDTFLLNTQHFKVRIKSKGK